MKTLMLRIAIVTFITHVVNAWAVEGTTAIAAIAADEKSSATEQPKGLTVHWKDRYLEVLGSNIPGDSIRTHYLEAYCRPGSSEREWKDTVIRHESRLVSAAPNGKRLEIEDRLADGVIVSHVIEAGIEEVTFSVIASNPTTIASQVHWAQPCMRVDKFTGSDPANAREVYPPYIRKCFLMIGGKLTRLPTEPWATTARYVPGQVYVPASVDRNDVNPRPLSILIPSSGLTGCFSADENMILAVAWEPTQEVFQGVITCIHNDFHIGGLAPNESKSIRGKMYILPANEKELLMRFNRDFPERLAE